uniref:Kinesin motor domain-containing protein n=1 Tax=Glossina brevipalpis TaxID=37001 RepID=A0A1A9X1Y1_9MUSC
MVPQLAVEKVGNFNQVKEEESSIVSDMLDKCFRGFDAMILVNGQTGSWKTLTVGTIFDGSLHEHAGINVVGIREDRSDILMVGLIARIVFSAKETIEYLVSGSSGIAIASRAMNQKSSRSLTYT